MNRGSPPKPPAEPFARYTAVMSLGTALSRITGFLRLSAMAYALGVAESRLADAYNIANTTPNIIYELILGGVLSSVFVPVFVEWLERRGREEAWEVARAVMTLAIVLLTAIMVLGIVFAPWIVRLYTLRAGPEAGAARALATFFLRWFLPQLVFYGLGAVATGLLNSHRRFAAPMFAPVLNNVVAIGTFIAFAAMPGPSLPTPDGITTPQRYVLAIGTTLGVIAMTVALWPSLSRLGFRLRPVLSLRQEGVRQIARLSLWAFVYVLVNQLGYLIVIVLAAGQPGGYTAYSAAFILFQLPHGIFAVSVMTALLPALSSRWADRDRPAFRALLSRGIRGTAFIVVPAAVGYIVLAKPIVRLLLQHGIVTPRSTNLVAGVLALFSVGLFSFSTFQLLLRAFYGMQDTRTPAIINVAAVALNTVVNFAYFALLGVKGLALGHATAYTFATIVALFLLRRRLEGLEGRRLLAGLSKILLAAGATAAAAWLAARGLGAAFGVATLSAQAIQVFGSVAAGVVAFVAAASLLRVEELGSLKELVRTPLRR